MFGHVVAYETQTNEGEVLGEDEKYYPFHIGEWLSESPIKIGQKVFYEVEEAEARNIQIDEKKIFHLKVEVHHVVN